MVKKWDIEADFFLMYKNQISNFGFMSYGHFLARNGSKEHYNQNMSTN